MKLNLLLKQIDVRDFGVFKRRTSKFGYLKDHLFLITVSIYFLNRYIVKPLTVGRISFFHSYLNDLICIPFWLPIVLFLTRLVRLRDHDEPPDFYELSFYLLIWSVMFEVVGPLYGKYYNYPVADPWDVVCYALGCVIAGIYWNFEMRERYSPQRHEV